MGTNLTMANLRGADLENAILKGADLRGADLSDVLNLTDAQLSDAIVDEDTKLPATLHAATV